MIECLIDFVKNLFRHKFTKEELIAIESKRVIEVGEFVVINNKESGYNGFFQELKGVIEKISVSFERFYDPNETMGYIYKYVPSITITQNVYEDEDFGNKTFIIGGRHNNTIRLLHFNEMTKDQLDLWIENHRDKIVFNTRIMKEEEDGSIRPTTEIDAD